MVGIETWRSRNFRPLAAAAGFVVLRLGLVLGMYFMIWRRIPPNQSAHWGNKYGVFYRPKTPSDSALGWYACKYAEIAEFRGARRDLVDPELVPSPMRERIRSLDALAWLAVHVMGLAVMALQRRYREALLFPSPALVCAVFNVLGYWPFGAFRTNVFMLAELSTIAALAMDWQGLQKRAWTVLVPVALLVFLPLAVSKNDWGATKQVVPYSQMGEMIEQILALPATQDIRREPFFLDRHTAYPFRFHVRDHAPRWRVGKAHRAEVRLAGPGDGALASRRARRAGEYARPLRHHWLRQHAKRGGRERRRPAQQAAAEAVRPCGTAHRASAREHCHGSALALQRARRSRVVVARDRLARIAKKARRTPAHRARQC